MAIILYDAIPSSNSDRVKIALHEKGLAYERVTLDLAKKEQKRPEFLKLNPYGKVPVINDNGQILFESCIINEVFCDCLVPQLLVRANVVQLAGGQLIGFRKT